MGIGDVVARTTTVLEPEIDDAPPATLREVLNTLGPMVLAHVAGPDHHLDEPVGDPLVLGPGEPVPELTDELVLLTGGRETQTRFAEALARVAAADGRTVVVKSWGLDLADLVDAVETAGTGDLTLLVTPDETAWRQLDAMVTAARTAAVRIGPGDGTTTGDLFALANSIAASLGGPVTIEETSGRVMAYSNLPGQEIDEIRRLAILGRQTPDRPTNAAEYQAVIRGPGPVKFESSDPAYPDRMAIAVRAGHQALGLIWVLCDRPGLVPDADRVLTDAARATALHLLRVRGTHDPGRTRRSEALRGLLSGTTPVDEVAGVLGLSPTTWVAMAAVRPAGRHGGAETAEAVTARVLDLVALHGEYWHPAAATVLEPGSIALALPVPVDGAEGADGTDRLGARLRKLGNDLVTAARRSGGVELTVAVGPVVPLADAARSRRLSEQVAEVLTGPQQVATLDDVRSAVVLAAVRAGRPADDEALLLPQVRALLQHDRTQGTEYGQTLLVHLGSFGDMTTTAAALNVHENTARYRVKRLDEMFGIDLSGGDETLVTWLQVRSACGPPQPPGPR
jgi:hypothetical protein